MDNTQPPNFIAPTSTLSPTVNSLLNENELFIEHGISYTKYVSLKPLDNLDVVKNSKLVSYFYRDQNCFLNTKRVFLKISYTCMNSDNTALTQENNVSCCNVMAHSLIDSCILNIGEANINRCDGYYPLIAKYNYLTRYTKEARSR